MKAFKCAILFVVIAGCVYAAEPAPAVDKPKAEHKPASDKAFVGTWELVTVQPEGAAKAARRLVFRADGTYAALDQDGKELWAGTYELNPDALPKIWDHRSHEAKQKGEDALGIYELDGDALKVCVVVGKWQEKQWVGKARPKDFKLENADVVIELRRVKSDKP